MSYMTDGRKRQRERQIGLLEGNKGIWILLTASQTPSDALPTDPLQLAHGYPSTVQLTHTLLSTSSQFSVHVTDGGKSEL